MIRSRSERTYDLGVDGENSDSSAAAPSRSWFGSCSPRQLQRSEKLALAAGVVFVVPWSVFVVEGSQFAYLIALAFSATAAALLAWSRSWLVVLFIVALATLVGTEARGELGGGTAPLGSLRLLDAALLAAGAGLFARHALDRGFRSTSRALILRWPRAISVEAWIVGAAVVWATILWIANGAAHDAFVRTDVRLILLAAGTYVLARAVVPGQWWRFMFGLLALAPILALKSLLIYATSFVTVGTWDRLQATFVGVPSRRVILVGGDTVLILAPALAMAMALHSESRTVRWWCTLTAICGMGGVLLSGTRTNLLVSVALVLATLCLPIYRRRLRVTQLTAVAGVLIVLATATGVYATGLAERLVAGDEPHVGLNFRRDEIESAARLPQGKLLFGQGLGGSFASRDIRGATVETGWSHVLPIWIVLKVGLLGLVALLCALSLLARRLAPAVRKHGHRAALSGGQLIVGLILMSLTINRLAQPEGAILIAIGAVLVSMHRGGAVRCD